MGETAAPGEGWSLSGSGPWTLKSYRLVMEHLFDPPPWPADLELLDLDSKVQFSATMEVDAEAYKALAGDEERLFTVRQEIDLNPWHRKATGWGPRAHKLRDILAWELRRRILRRDVLEHISIEVPNCRLQAGPTSPSPGDAVSP